MKKQTILYIILIVSVLTAIIFALVMMIGPSVHGDADSLQSPPPSPQTVVSPKPSPSLPSDSVSSSGTNTENAESQSVITQNVMYSFADTNLTMLKSIDLVIGKAMDYDRMNESGALEDGYSVAVTQMTVKNMLDAPQTVMLNNVSLSFTDDGAPISASISMRYFDQGDASSSAYFKCALEANEELACTVGFLINDSWLAYGEPIFSINPSGTFPPDEDARFVPITLTSAD
ncbi:MAG: hypothetical protein RR502_04860 [Oscillospiraceae bacterium]